MVDTKEHWCLWEDESVLTYTLGSHWEPAVVDSTTLHLCARISFKDISLASVFKSVKLVGHESSTQCWPWAAHTVSQLAPAGSVTGSCDPLLS